MDRRQQPPAAAEPDMAGKISEIRMAERSDRHDRRNGREVVA